MVHFFSDQPNLIEFSQQLTQINASNDVKSILIFSADANAFDELQVTALLQNLSKPVMGGIFPQIIYQSKAYEQGYLLIGLPYAIDVKRIDGLSDAQTPFAEKIDEVISDQDPAQTYIVFVDGLAKCISGLVDGLFDVLGSEPNFIGGGAGSLSFVQKPCLFCNEGLFADSALIGILDQPSRLGVGHGWTTIDADHQITQVDKNIIHEIDHRNAFEVYREIVNRYSATQINEENFFSIAQAFPFGINKLNGEKVVRDPIALTETGAMICVGELSEGDFVDILSAQPDQLISAAGETARSAYQTQPTNPASLTLLMDCISRALFLKADFNQELDAVRKVTGHDLPLFGALVLGEIANSGSGYLEFYNKTTVVASI
jgi:hypothetical protein